MKANGSAGILGSPARITAVTAIMTACVTLATIAFPLFVPATGGYFNLGESLVYLSALLFGPLVGAFAGGVGSMLADVSLGFPQFAPGTLLIKGIEGYVVGYLSKMVRSARARKVGVKTSIAIGSAIGVSLALIGITGVIVQPVWGPLTVSLEPVIWVTVSVLAGILTGYVVYRSEVNGLVTTLSMLAGGACMVTGYLLYEQLILGVLTAIAEVPFNLMQCLIGIVIAFPVFSRVGRAIGT